MKILSVSTATNFLTISLNEDEKVIKQVEEKDQRNHSEHLDPMIDKLLKDCNLSLKQIDRLAVAIGPGSYTGLRIGITTMKMFASILNKEIVGISTLQALAANKQAADSLTLACLDARNNNFFAGAYVNGEAVIADGHYSFEALLEELKKVLAEKNIQKLIILGSGMEKHEDLLNSLPLIYGFFFYNKEVKIWRVVMGHLTVTILINIMLNNYLFSLVSGVSLQVTFIQRLPKEVILPWGQMILIRVVLVKSF